MIVIPLCLAQMVEARLDCDEGHRMKHPTISMRILNYVIMIILLYAIVVVRAVCRIDICSPALTCRPNEMMHPERHDNAQFACCVF